MAGRICKFWQRGYCKNDSMIYSPFYFQVSKLTSVNAAACRFEHPGANTNANSNPFGAPSSNTNRFSALSTGGNRNQENPYKITKDIIRTDLGIERPSWMLSCYGPGRDAPEQLFGGYPREQSPEEVMLYVRGSSNQQQAV